MEASILVALISAAAALVVAAFSYLFTKKKERDADWLKYKYEQYRVFVVSLSGIVGTNSTLEGNCDLARASNMLYLIGTKGVIDALHAFLDEVNSSKSGLSSTVHNTLLSKLIWEIRKDLKTPGTPKEQEFSARLWCPGAK